MERRAQHKVRGVTTFSKGVPASEVLLSGSEKHELALSLLDEFGAQNVTEHGDELVHSCCLPFGAHRNGDANPSASLNWRKLAYNCLGCGGKGSLFWFISVCRGESIGTIRDWVASKSALDTEESLAALLVYLDALYAPQGAAIDSPIPRFPMSVLTPWMRVHPYLTEMRHIRRENILKHLVGYDESCERIVLPHMWEGSLVGWQTRRMVDDGTAKYINTPDFPKDRTLYNSTVESPTLVVVESAMTVVAKSHLDHDYGFVGTFGASVTDHQMALLYDDPRPILLWFDNDPHGWKAMSEVGKYLERDADVSVVPSPWNEDAGGLDDETTLELLRAAVPFCDYSPPSYVKEWSP
jgi:Toprim-like